jgi:hypothetical protein
LLLVYLHDPTGKIQGIRTDAMERPTAANIFALKYVIGKMSSSCRNTIAPFVERLLRIRTPDTVLAVLVALKTLFKVGGSSLDKYSERTVSYLRAAFDTGSESVQIAAVRLGDALLGIGDADQLRLLCDIGFEEGHSQFVKISCAQLVGRRAASMLQPGTKPLESGTPPDLRDAFGILKRYPPHFSMIFSRFLDFADPAYVHNQVKLMFGFAYQNSVPEILKVTAFFGKSIRAMIFNDLFFTKQLAFLKLITFDEESARRTAGLANEKICSANERERGIAATFFVSLAFTFPDVAAEYLQVAVQYLAMPPLTTSLEYDGMASVAAIILSVIGNSQDLSGYIMELLNEFLEHSLGVHADNDRFLMPSFMVMSTLDKSLIPRERVEQILVTVLGRIKNASVRLIECILLFLSTHPNYSVAEKFSMFSIDLLGRLSRVGHLALLRTILAVDMPPSFYFQASVTFIQLALRFGIALEDIKKICPNLMRIREEQFRSAFRRGKAVKERCSLLFFVDESYLARRICEALPRLFVKMRDADIPVLMNVTIPSGNRVVGHLAILSILKDPEAAKRVPIGIDDQLLKILESNNSILIQITAECIAWHISRHPERLRTSVNYIAANESIEACFLEAAIVRVVDLSDRDLFDVIFRLAQRVNIPLLTNYVLNELVGLYEAKGKQLAALSLGDQQCQIILNLLMGPNPQDLFTCDLAAHCLERLVPVLMTTQENESTRTLLILALQTFYYSPIPLMKQMFYEVFKALTAYSTDLIDRFEIKLPFSGTTPINTRLSACAVIAKMAKLRPVKLADLDRLAPFLLLLQRTQDKRVAEMLIASAQSDLSPKWFHITKQLLSVNAMPGFGDCQVEPNVTVKCCALKIMDALLPALATDSVLDDIMASTIAAIPERLTELDTVAFRILKKVLEAFRDAPTRPLTKHDEQLKVAVRASFPSAVDVSADFNVAFQELFLADFDGDPEKCLNFVQLYVNGLSHVVIRTAGFFAIASELCVLAQGIPFVADRFKRFLTTLRPLFSAVLLDLIRVRTSGQRLSIDRSKISPFYHNFLRATIWLRRTYPAEDSLTAPVIVSFFLLELSPTSEDWRCFSACAALNSLLRNELDAESVGLVVTTISTARHARPELFGPLVDDFVNAVSSLKVEDEAFWVSVVCTAVNGRCGAAAFGKLLAALPVELVRRSAAQLVEFAVALGDCAVVGVLVEKVGDPILAILVGADGFAENKIRMIGKAYEDVGTRVAIDRVAQLFADNLGAVAWTVLGEVVAARPQIGAEILRRGVVQKLVAPGGEGGSDWFAFAEVAVAQLGEVREVVADVAAAALRRLAAEGRGVAGAAMTLLKKCDERGKAASGAFAGLGGDEKEAIGRLLEQFVAH